MISAFLAWVWSAAGGYIVSALGGAAAVAFVWAKTRSGSKPTEAKKIERADKGGEETAQLEKRLGEAASTAAIVDSAKRGVNAQSDDSNRNIASSHWVRK